MLSRRLGLVIVPMLVLGSGCGGDDGRPAATRTATAAATSTATSTVTVPPSATRTPTPSAGLTPSSTATVTCACTQTETSTPTPTATARPAEPRVSAFGVARADDLVQQPDLFDDAGRPVFLRATGQGMTLFVEGARGARQISPLAYDPGGNPPGLELIVSRPLGDGSLAVCDYDPPIIGGVPAVTPLEFSDDPMVTGAVADLGCRVNDGTGLPAGRSANVACTRDLSAEFSFVDPLSDIQFCLPIAKAWAFPPGDTIVATRVRDIAGRVSAPLEIVIRVAGEVPFECEDGLGERVFTPARGAASPVSQLLSTAGELDVSRDPWRADPLRLCAGPDLGDGIHQLTLRQDVLLGIPLVDGTVLCAKLQARGSDGLLDCGSATPLDVRATQAVGDDRVVVDTGLGLPAGTGGALLRAPVALAQLRAGASTGGCIGADYNFSYAGALTTARATAEAINAEGETLATLSHVGEPFRCASWRDGDGAILVLPIPGADTAVGATASVLVLAE